ncbi:hypothetical protein GDO81_027635 [Engystomops pustulosus]|uniref:Uncharacterized protein n=1 Tax=Engystomops pustulosus TaxID=76066 RepID=A0AAV6ZHI1_ENGPU|nr:hypothetical protein GDO81_027635 [Engystomops pustulosus]
MAFQAPDAIDFAPRDSSYKVREWLIAACLPPSGVYVYSWSSDYHPQTSCAPQTLEISLVYMHRATTNLVSSETVNTNPGSSAPHTQQYTSNVM